MDRTGLIRVNDVMHNTMHVLRRWTARNAGWLAALGLMAGAPQAVAGDYENSPDGAAFIS